MKVGFLILAVCNHPQPALTRTRDDHIAFGHIPIDDDYTTRRHARKNCALFSAGRQRRRNEAQHQSAAWHGRMPTQIQMRMLTLTPTSTLSTMLTQLA
ncbi:MULTISPECIES: hypothetical protein [unclassified Chelatococcus]|uniref:hypothetical protein n=1 Tax=unclassified Chelatococcus TaxID=2638111 RepID=UPI0020BE0639|nr:MULTISPECIES: hypothetical protein [unclassified Chelatococcus]